MIFEFEAEVRLLRWSESSTAGRTITLELPPDAGEGHPFRGLPTGHQHGQRFLMKFSAIGDDEQPASEPAPTGCGHSSHYADECPDMPSLANRRSEYGKERYALSDVMEQARTRSVMLAKDQEFQVWCGYHSEEAAAAFIRRACYAHSRSKIATDYLTYEHFLKMESHFKEAVGRATEMRA